MEVRRAKEDDLNAVYMMGYDVWSDGLESNDY